MAIVEVDFEDLLDALLCLALLAACCFIILLAFSIPYVIAPEALGGPTHITQFTSLTN